jgi:hypothetical protein
LNHRRHLASSSMRCIFAGVVEGIGSELTKRVPNQRFYRAYLFAFSTAQK